MKVHVYILLLFSTQVFAQEISEKSIHEKFEPPKQKVDSRIKNESKVQTPALTPLDEIYKILKEYNDDITIDPELLSRDQCSVPGSEKLLPKKGAPLLIDGENSCDENLKLGDIVGDTFPKCVQDFRYSAIHNYIELLNSAKGAKNYAEVYGKMLLYFMGQFNENLYEAKNRMDLFLSGSCGLLSKKFEEEYRANPDNLFNQIPIEDLFDLLDKDMETEKRRAFEKQSEPKIERESLIKRIEQESSPTRGKETKASVLLK